VPIQYNSKNAARLLKHIEDPQNNHATASSQPITIINMYKKSLSFRGVCAKKETKYFRQKEVRKGAQGMKTDVDI
jgi:hypothetical protein